MGSSMCEAQCISCVQQLVLMQAALEAYGADDEELWLRYMAYLQARKKSTGQLHWRASKMLKDPAKFHAVYQAQQQGVMVS